MNKIWRFLELLFRDTLRPMPDQTKLGMWWYSKSDKIFCYFHRKHCDFCKKHKN